MKDGRKQKPPRMRIVGDADKVGITASNTPGNRRRELSPWTIGSDFPVFTPDDDPVLEGIDQLGKSFEASVKAMDARVSAVEARQAADAERLEKMVVKSTETIMDRIEALDPRVGVGIVDKIQTMLELMIDKLNKQT